MIEVRINFKSLDEAIVALGRMAGGATAKAAVRVAAAPEPPAVEEVKRNLEAAQTAAAAPPEPGKKERKPRSDKDKPRGAYKPREGTTGALPIAGEGQQNIAKANAGSDVAPPPQTAAPAPTTAPAGAPVVAASVSAAPGAAAPSEADAQKALEGVFSTKGLLTAQSLLGNFGVSRLRDLPADQRAGFIEQATKAAEAE